MDIDYIVKVKKDANMELTSSKGSIFNKKIFNNLLLYGGAILYVIAKKNKAGLLFLIICFLVLLLFPKRKLDCWKIIIDNSKIDVKKFAKRYKINFEDLIDIRIESDFLRGSYYNVGYSKECVYDIVIEYFYNNKVKKLILIYKKDWIIFDDKDKEVDKSNVYNNISDEDVDKLMNLFIKKSQINENNKDIEQYKDIRTQSKNVMIEELKSIEQEKKASKVKETIKMIILCILTLLFVFYGASILHK